MPLPIYGFLRHVTGWVSEAWPLGGFLGHAGCHFLVVPKKKYLPIFLYFCLFSSHYSEIFAQSQDWQNSVTLKHGTSALQNRMGALGPHCTESWTTLMATGWVSKTWQLDHWICTLEKDKDKVQKCHFLSWTLGMPLSCPFYSIWPNLMTCLKPLALVWVLDKEQVCCNTLEWRPKKHFQAFLGQYWGPNVKIRVDTHAFLMLMCHNWLCPFTPTFFPTVQWMGGFQRHGHRLGFWGNVTQGW